MSSGWTVEALRRKLVTAQQSPAVVLRVAGRPKLDAHHAVTHLANNACNIGSAGSQV
jgi:hypothetical protein